MNPTLQEILDNTVESRQNGEVAFMHVFTSNMIRGARMEHAWGVTFSLKMNDVLIVISSDPTSRVESGPFAVGPFTAVVVSSGTTGNRRADAVVSAYVPDRAAATAQKLVFHFFEAEDAVLFCTRACAIGKISETMKK